MNSKLNDFGMEVPDTSKMKAKLAIIGVGNAGTNAINNMVKAGISGVTFFAAEMDQSKLDGCLAPEENRILLMQKDGMGLGAGMSPEVGSKATENTMPEIIQKLEGFDCVIVTAGMGGGTGSGGASIIAKKLKESNILTISIVVKCSKDEGPERVECAEQGIAALEKATDPIIVVRNDKVDELYEDLYPWEAFAKADDVLVEATKGLVYIIQSEMYRNVDFNDIKTVLKDAGYVIISTGSGVGESAGSDAVKAALSNPFFDDLEIKPGCKILTAADSRTHKKKIWNEAYNAIHEAAGGTSKNPVVNIKPGENYENESEEFTITLLAPAVKKNEAKEHKKVEKEIIAEPILPKISSVKTHKTQPLITQQFKGIFDTGADLPFADVSDSNKNTHEEMVIIKPNNILETIRNNSNLSKPTADELDAFTQPANIRYNGSAAINNRISNIN